MFPSNSQTAFIHIHRTFQTKRRGIPIRQILQEGKSLGTVCFYALWRVVRKFDFAGDYQKFMLMADKLNHCGIFRVTKRRSVSNADSGRSSDVFGHLYMLLYAHYKDFLSDSYLSLKINIEVDPDTLETFDSTVVSLFKEAFKACGRLPLDGRKKGGLKAFTKITLSERMPNFICLKAAATN
jgi:hypothetical protein